MFVMKRIFELSPHGLNKFNKSYVYLDWIYLYETVHIFPHCLTFPSTEYTSCKTFNPLFDVNFNGIHQLQEVQPIIWSSVQMWLLNYNL